MLLERFIPRVDLWSLWPVILIVIGLLMVFRRRGE
jgi:hypothetical protein